MESARKYFVGGNWKCNGTVDKNRELITEVINKLEFDTSKVGMFLLIFNYFYGLWCIKNLWICRKILVNFLLGNILR